MWCGFAVEKVLEVAHLDGNRANCKEDNLALLCPTCHRMHDVDLITTEEVIARMKRLQAPRVAGVGELHEPLIEWCIWCGFGIAEGMQAASPVAIGEDAACLCPTCHRRYENGFIDRAELQLRHKHRNQEVRWKKLSKDAGVKAGRTRRLKAAARRAVATRLARRADREGEP